MLTPEDIHEFKGNQTIHDVAYKHPQCLDSVCERHAMYRDPERGLYIKNYNVHGEGLSLGGISESDVRDWLQQYDAPKQAYKDAGLEIKDA